MTKYEVRIYENIDLPLLKKQIDALSHLLDSKDYPEEHILWGAVYLLEAIYEEKTK